MVLLGAGQRGRLYSSYIVNAGYAEITAIVEPNAERKIDAGKKLGVPDSLCFDNEDALWDNGKIADAAIISSMDRDHYRQAMRALDLGYDLLLEKPISPSAAECISLAKKAKETGRNVVVCHVIRYTAFYNSIKNIIDSGEFGRVISILHEENIGNFHMAHSFVRGNWSRAGESSPIIMQKSCHDMDLLHWLTGSRAKSISSIGALNYFKPDNAPANSTERCYNCPAEKDCRYSAYKNYVPVRGSWPASVLCLSQTEEALIRAIKEGPYGRCVYRAGNDVCDNQVSLIEFENNITASFSMSAFSNRIYRNIRVLFEDGELRGDDGPGTITVNRFSSNGVSGYDERVIHTARPQSGHGGGDYKLVDEFIKLISGQTKNSPSSIEHSVESHIMAEAAEISRLENGKRIDLYSLRVM
jgi:predicted dehydrogenase